MPDIPTSDMNTFKKQLENVNTPFTNMKQQGDIKKIKKNLVVSYVSDSTGCGHIRNVFPMTYLNSVFGKSGRFNLLMSPMMIFQEDVLVRARTLYFQRTMDPRHLPIVKKYSELKKKYNYNMVYDIDDFIWRGPDEGEEIPEYNFGSKNITDPVRASALEIMNEMDIVCTSTDFLGQYIKDHGVTSKIVTVPNAVCQSFWGPHRRRPIKSKIEKPRVLYTGSPTHYHNGKKLKGDWENAWCDWVLKAVTDDKINFCVMGGLPWFFEPIKDKIRIIPWVNSYQYHLPVKEFRPDIGIAPLVPNYFNYSKSDIKHIEYEAAGCVSIGSTFTNGMPSPYDNNIIKVDTDITVKDINELIDDVTEPERFNEIIKAQYKQLDTEGRWLESPDYVKLLTSIF